MFLAVSKKLTEIPSPPADRMSPLDEIIARHKMPSPSEEEQADPRFEAIWLLIKSWDINVPKYYSGYMGATGRHVKLILDALEITALPKR